MRRWLSLLTLLVCLTPLAAGAQTVRVSGKIVDPSGAVLPGVAVKAALAADPQTATNTATTDGSGRYELRLPPGAYVLKASLPGFADIERTVTVRDAEVTRDFSMKVGTLQETITIVAGEAPAPPRAAARPTPQASTPTPTPAPSSPTSAAVPGPPPAPRRSATPVRVGGNIKPPTKTRNVPPVYPEALAAEKIGGVVILEAVIGPDGHVREAKTLRSPNEELTRAASDAIRQWEFTPTLLNGAPIAVVMTATFNFQAE
jgi:TonB family protein